MKQFAKLKVEQIVNVGSYRQVTVMNDTEIRQQPDTVTGILDDTVALGFTMASDPRVGALLAVLAASKPGGSFLELGTGTGHGTAWLLSGMDAVSTLDTVDSDPEVVAVARRHLRTDERVTFHVMDGAVFLQGQTSREVRPHLRGCVAWQVHSPKRSTLPAPAGWDLRD